MYSFVWVKEEEKPRKERENECKHLLPRGEKQQRENPQLKEGIEKGEGYKKQER